MGDEREPMRLPGTPPTLPRGLHGGTNGEVSWLRDSTRLPGFPVALLSGEPGREGQVPVTVAGPRRICTGFRVSPFVWSSVVQQRLVYWLWRSRRKGRLQLGLEPATLGLVGSPLLRGGFRLPTQVARIECGEGVEQLGRGRRGRLEPAAPGNTTRLPPSTTTIAATSDASSHSGTRSRPGSAIRSVAPGRARHRSSGETSVPGAPGCPPAPDCRRSPRRPFSSARTLTDETGSANGSSRFFWPAGISVLHGELLLARSQRCG